MSLADRLVRLAAGERDPGDWLLGSCALTSARGDVYGEEAVAVAFCSAPATVGTSIVTPRGVALFGDGAALFADVYDGRVGRLWRVDGDPAVAQTKPAEHRVAVAFDPDLAQRRGDVVAAARAVDLAEGALARLTAALLPLVIAAPGEVRRRAFVVRAFGDDHATAGLAAIHTAAAGGIGFSYAAAMLTPTDAVLVVDRPGDAPWSPRL